MRRLFLLFFVMVTAVSSATAVTASEPQSPPAAGTDWRFGVIESYESPGDASALGASWTRVQFHWAETQPNGSGEWLPQVSDAQINTEISAGRMVTGLLIGIPGWAMDSKGLPRGLWLPHDDPNNTWGVFVRDAVSRYQGRIDHWIIWNEPDISADAVAHTWNGTERDLFQLQRTAYLVAKEANPNAVIHLSAFTHFWDPGYFGRFLDEVISDPGAAEHNYYFDVATAHLYFQPGTIYDLVQVFYGTMSGRGIWKPVWVVESNAPPIDDPEWPVPNWTFAVSLDEQAAFMPQMLASSLAAGAQRVAVFKLKDTPTDMAANPEPFGLVSMNGRRRPAFTTYQIAMRYLSGMTAASRERWDSVGQFRIEQGETQTTTVLFSRLLGGERVQVAAETSTAVLVDMWGSRRTITAVDGQFTVDLPGAICSQSMGDYCMIGGAVYYLVQGTGGSAPPAPVSTALPEVAVAATEIVTATATIEPTPSPTKTLTPTATVTPSPTATNTVTPTNTPSATPTAAATAVPTNTLTATPLPLPTATAVPQPVSNPQPPVTGYWFLGGAALVLLGMMGWWWRHGRSR